MDKKRSTRAYMLSVDVPNTQRDRRMSGWHSDEVLPKGRYVVTLVESTVALAEGIERQREDAYIRGPKGLNLNVARWVDETWAVSKKNEWNELGCNLMAALVPDDSIEGYLRVLANDFITGERLLLKLVAAGVIDHNHIALAAVAVEEDLAREDGEA